MVRETITHLMEVSNFGISKMERGRGNGYYRGGDQASTRQKIDKSNQDQTDKFLLGKETRQALPIP